jgi:hypothetical protein
MKKFSVWQNIIVWTSNLLFILLYFTLSYYNRIAVDDFYFLGNVQEWGVWQATIVEYETWSTRWSSVFLTHFVLGLYKFKYFLFFYHTLVLLALFGAFYYLIKNLSFRLNLVLTRFELILAAIFITNAIFFSTIKIGETWFWLCATNTYVLSMIFLLLGFSAIIQQKAKYWPDIFTVICFLYVGGSNESLAVFILPALIACLIYFKFSKQIIFPAAFLRRCAFALAALLSAFFVLYSGGGMKVRQSFFQEISLLEAFLLNFKMSGIIFIRYLPSILHFLLLFSLPAFFLGQQNKQVVPVKKIVVKIAIVSVSCILLILAFQFPITYKTQDVGAFRALFPVTFILFFAVSLVFFLLGKHCSTRIPRGYILLIFSFSSIINFFTLQQQLPLVREYSKAYDYRIERMKKQNKAELKLPPLPQSGFLVSAEISNDTAHSVTQHFVRALQIKERIKVQNKFSADSDLGIR